VKPKSRRRGHVPMPLDYWDLFRWFRMPRATGEKQPLRPTTRDVEYMDFMLRVMRNGSERSISASHLAFAARGQLLHSGTPSSWHKRLRRLALFGWVGRTRTGAWKATRQGIDALS